MSYLSNFHINSQSPVLAVTCLPRVFNQTNRFSFAKVKFVLYPQLNSCIFMAGMLKAIRKFFCGNLMIKVRSMNLLDRNYATRISIFIDNTILDSSNLHFFL